MILVALSAHAAELEAVVFPGDRETGPALAEVRLSALEHLSPPPVTVVREGPRLRVTVAEEQVPALLASSWVVPIAPSPPLDVAAAVASARAEWKNVTGMVVVMNQSPIAPIVLHAASGEWFRTGRVPAGDYDVLFAGQIAARLTVEPGQIERLACDAGPLTCAPLR